MPVSPRILFVLKHRETPYTGYQENPYSYSSTFSSGLYNSVRFVAEMLTYNGIENRVIEAHDNNDIAPAIGDYAPSCVILEALWVVPEKVAILRGLYPDVNWVIRIHSDLPFLANEGVAIDWITRYLKIPNVTVAANSPFALRDLRRILRSANPQLSEHEIERKLILLPNSYPIRRTEKRENHFVTEELNIGCFGAIRPLKNNLIQAVAAIHYADKVGRKLHFHINAGRSEQGGDRNLKNIRALFNASTHELVEHPWMPHAEFLRVVSGMTVMLCCSFSETFCIVAGDAVALGVPTVVSSEIAWVSPLTVAAATDSDSITAAIGRALHPIVGWLASRHSRVRLASYCEETERIWVGYLEGESQ